MTVSKSRPPNFALTLVNWWSKKPHRTLHHADTDEEMVSQYPTMCYGTRLMKWAIRFPSSKGTPTDPSRKANTSWVDVIGAKSRWRRCRVIYHSTSAWKRSKGMERRSGEAFTLVQFTSESLSFFSGIPYEHPRRDGFLLSKSSELSSDRDSIPYSRVFDIFWPLPVAGPSVRFVRLYTLRLLFLLYRSAACALRSCR